MSSSSGARLTRRREPPSLVERQSCSSPIPATSVDAVRAEKVAIAEMVERATRVFTDHCLEKATSGSDLRFQSNRRSESIDLRPELRHGTAQRFLVSTPTRESDGAFNDMIGPG